MTPEEFVQCLRREHQQLLGSYLNAASDSEVAHRLRELGLSTDQLSALRGILSTVLTDAFYTILLGLDGCAALGGVQQGYRIHDEHGLELCRGDGTLEGLAFTYFHGGRDA